jgi:hypothetical protein
MLIINIFLGEYAVHGERGSSSLSCQPGSAR